MKKSTITALVFIIPLITIGSLILVGFATATNQHTDCRNSIVSIGFQNSSVTVNNGDYNISYSLNAILPTTIDKIHINPGNLTVPNTNTDANGVTIYINGTEINIARPLNYHLNSGDNLQVNVIIPCTEANSNQTSITIFTPQTTLYTGTMLT